MPYITIDTKQIYYEEYGKENKRTIVYFHGGPGVGCLNFTNQAKLLAEKFHVIIFDQYGCLRSEAIDNDQPFDIQYHLMLIDQMRKEMKIPSWTILGHSYGGMLACLYANAYPQSIDAIIFDCPSFDFILSAKSISKFFVPYYKNFKPNGVKNAIKVIDTEYQDKKQFMHDFWHVIEPVEDEKMRNYLHGISVEEFNEHYPIQNLSEECRNKGFSYQQKIFQADYFFENHFSALKEIKKPLLLLVGKFDPVCCEVQRKYFQKHAFNGTTIEFENSGHFPHLEEPEVYKNAISTWVEHFVRRYE